MVVFEDGLPRKSEYRRFVIRGVDGQNDVASMHEVITRPVPGGCYDERVETPASWGPRPAGAAVGPRGDPPGPMLVDPETGRPRKFAYAPGPRRGRRRPAPGRRRPAGPRRARHRRHRGVRAGQAARGGLAARARRTR